MTKNEIGAELCYVSSNAKAILSISAGLEQEYDPYMVIAVEVLAEDILRILRRIDDGIMED